MRTEVNTIENCLTLNEMTAYLTHQMNDAVTTLVDAHLQHCQLCCGALESLESHIADAARAKRLENDFKAEVSRAEEAALTTDTSPGWMKYAAVILLLLLPSYFFFQNYFSHSGEKLYEEYFHPYEDLLSTRSGSATLSARLMEAMSYYNKGEYEQAALLFDEELKEGPAHPFVRLYAGIAWMESEQAGKAVFYFERLSAEGGPLADQAKWYLALTYVKTEHKAAAATLLQQIERQEGPYSGKAAELLEKL